jgi:hypothetical protein
LKIKVYLLQMQSTYQQKVNQGIIKEPKYTMCLRKKRAYKGGLVYQGAGKTEFTDKLHALANINVFIIN